ncbi:MAG: hypothetical protein JWQ20_3192 [Conexibacter sp.]|nr:hypothetical protein [Conexibacter sp.]
MDAGLARPTSEDMPTRLYFSSGRELTVSQSEDDVVLAVRRDYPNPVRLGGFEGGAEAYINWDQVDYVTQDGGPGQP